MTGSDYKLFNTQRRYKQRAAVKPAGRIRRFLFKFGRRTEAAAATEETAVVEQTAVEETCEAPATCYIEWDINIDFGPNIRGYKFHFMAPRDPSLIRR